MAGDLIILKFDSTYGAQNSLNAIQALTELNYAWLEDVAVVERHNSGRVSTHTTHGSVSGGFLWGGLTGMLLGLLFPPVGFLALWGIGAATGAIVEKVSKETGLPKDLLVKIKEELTKGTSALILLGATGDVDEMTKAFQKYTPVSVVRESVPEEAVTNLREALDKDATAQAAHGSAPAEGEGDGEGDTPPTP